MSLTVPRRAKQGKEERDDRKREENG